MQNEINTQWFIEEYAEITEDMINSLLEYQQKFDKRILDIGKLFLNELYSGIEYEILKSEVVHDKINVRRNVKVIFSVKFNDGMIVEDILTFPVKYYYLDDKSILDAYNYFKEKNK